MLANSQSREPRAELLCNSARGFGLKCAGRWVLTLQVHQLLQHLVHGGNDAGVGLVAALGYDHIDKFLG
jgi:hypothetical protein